MQLYRTLAADLDFNVMFSRRGHLTLAHNDSSLRTMRWRAEVNKLQGVDSEVIDPAEIKRLVPYLDTSAETRYPILGALYHPPGGIIRHDAVVWGYARAAAAQGVHIHQDTEVTGIDIDGGKVTRGAHDQGGHRHAGRAQRDRRLVHADRGDGRRAAADPDVPAAGRRHRARSAVPSCRGRVRHLHVYVSQTDRGELVFGASVDPFASYSTRGTLEFAEGLATHVMELMPALSKVRLLRQWSRAVRHDARLLAHHGRHAGGGLLRRRRLGHLRLQGRPGLRGGDGAVHRRRPRRRRSSRRSGWAGSARASWSARRGRPPLATDLREARR